MPGGYLSRGVALRKEYNLASADASEAASTVHPSEASNGRHEGVFPFGAF